MNDVAVGAAIAAFSTGEPADCHLQLFIDDPLVAEALHAYPEGAERERYAMTALRIGVQALNQARGRLDGDVVRHEGERILSALGGELDAHKRGVHEQVAATLREYFDPKSRRFNDRVGQPTSDGGE